MGCRYKNELGKRYGRYNVIALSEIHKGAIWTCRCDCGAIRKVQGGELRRGKALSCGCLQREMAKKRHTKHGKARERVYSIWNGMLTRCLNSKDHNFANYGAKGVTVCKEWLSFINFYNDMGEPPTPKHSLDRKDNNKGYLKENCRWADTLTQNYNKSNTVYLHFNSRKYTLLEAANEFKIPITVIRNRVKQKWPIDKILLTPVRTRRH